MPTYEYRCDACGHGFEEFQSMSADPIRKCPKCKKLKVKRLIGTGAGLIFKGSGFYITDYRDQSYTDKAKAESGTGSGGNGDATKSDSGGNGDSGKSADAKPTTTTTTTTDSKPAAKSEKSTPAKPAAAKESPKKKGK